MSDWKSKAKDVTSQYVGGDNTQAQPDWKSNAKSVDSTVNVMPEVSPAGAVLRGVTQSATLGFGDEFAGGVSAAGRMVGLQGLGGPFKDVTTAPGGATLDPDELLKSYQQTRDLERSRNKLAEQQQFGPYLTGTVAGGVIPMAVGGGALKGIQGATRLGMLAGAGTSDIDLTNPNMPVSDKALGLGKDVALGGTIAGGIASIPAGLGKVGNALANTKPGKSFLRGVGGELFDQMNFKPQAQSNALELGTNTLGKLQTAEKNAAINKSNLIKTNKTPIDVQEARQAIEQGMNDLVPEGGTGPLSNTKANALQDISDKFKDETKTTIDNVVKRGWDAKKVPETASARKQLEDEITREKVTADALGQSLRHEIKESVGDDGKKYLTKITTSDEPIGNAEKLIPIKNEEGKVVDQALERGDDQFKTTAKAKTVEDTPGNYEQTQITPTEKNEQVITLNKIRNNQPLTPLEAQQLEKTLGALADVPEYKPFSSSISSGQQKLREAINKIPELAKANERVVDINAARNFIGAGSKFGASDFNAEMGDPKQYKLANTIFGSAGETNSGTISQDKINKMMDILNKGKLSQGVQGPATETQGIASEFQGKLPKVQEDLELAESMNPSTNFSRAGALKAAIVRGSNPLGYYLGRPAAAVGGALSPLSQPLTGAGVTGTVMTGSDTKNADVQSLSKRVSTMSPNDLALLSQRLRSKPGMEAVANKLQSAAKSNSPIEKAQAEFVIQQNPAAKNALENPSGD